MIIVTGTKRSGTSMWMQILAAAGLSWIGEKFPRDWAQRFASANPQGFYESQLMAGIYYRTNPNPQTGAYLAPAATQAHAVKVFIPGLVRTDVAFIDRCIATVRPWREYVASYQRLRELFHASGDELGMPAALHWWVENYGLVRDIATRRYPAHVVSYAAVLADPERHVTEVMRWIGEGDAAAAIAAVRSARGDVDRTPAAGDNAKLPVGLEPHHVEVFDAFYDSVDREQPLSSALIAAMNGVHDDLVPRLAEYEHRDLLAGLGIAREP